MIKNIFTTISRGETGAAGENFAVSLMKVAEILVLVQIVENEMYVVETFPRSKSKL